MSEGLWEMQNGEIIHNLCVSIGQGWSIRIQYSYFKTFEYRIWVYSYLYLNNY